MPLMKAHGVRAKPFHLRYLELCKNKNVLPLQEVKAKNKNYSTLDFFADRVKLDDWSPILNALYYDTSLHYVAIKLRKNNSNVLENVNSIKRARKIHGTPILLTNHIFTQFVSTIRSFMQNNEHLTTLLLEGLPLKDNYIACIANGLSENHSIKNLSFARSALGDNGCEKICSNIKILTNIQCLNMSQCSLTAKGAKCIAELLNYQKIIRFGKGWESTLRYRTIDPDTLPGLKRITINGNQIHDEGVYFIMEVLKEDVWIKSIEMQNCGLTDDGAKMILDCLDYNKTLLMVDIDGNNIISTELVHMIKVQLGMDVDEMTSESEDSGSSEAKVSVQQLKEKIKLLECQLQNERICSRKIEELNEGLRTQNIEMQKKMESTEAFSIPDGFTLIETAYLDHLIEHQRSPNTQKNDNKDVCKKTKRVDKARSEIVQKKARVIEGSQSAFARFPSAERPLVSPRKLTFVEKNIGDTCNNISEPCEEDILKIFMKKRSSLNDSQVINVDGDPEGNEY
ncbi:protein Cep78 homolog [Culicoides brevitarsis]|uniref:protein Cep78 homolog n=1 Tax=Culicoides brevitarsis TaxID=469753 RepID=UPI00307C2372